MKLTKFDRLTKRDFENGAVIDEIRAAIKQRDALRETLGRIERLSRQLLASMPKWISKFIVDIVEVIHALAHDALGAAEEAA